MSKICKVKDILIGEGIPKICVPVISDNHQSIITDLIRLKDLEIDLIELRKSYNIDKILPGITGWAQINGRDNIGNEEKVIFISINSEKMKVYDIVKDEENEIDLDVPAMIVDESTMIPLRAVSEALGAKVEWNQQSNTVSLNI